MWDDHQTAMKIVSQNGFDLSLAPEEVRGNREIVLKAVSNWGEALQFSSEELRGDHEVVLRAVSCEACALRFATKDQRAPDYASTWGPASRRVVRHCLNVVFPHLPVVNKLLCFFWGKMTESD